MTQVVKVVTQKDCLDEILSITYQLLDDSERARVAPRPQPSGKLR
jgi:hypothetical protein